MPAVNYTQLSADYQRIERAILALEKTFLQQPRLDEIARSVALSEYHFQLYYLGQFLKTFSRRRSLRMALFMCRLLKGCTILEPFPDHEFVISYLVQE